MHTSDAYKQVIQATARFIRGQVTIGTTTHTDTTTLSALSVDGGAGMGKVIGLAVSAGAEIALTGGAVKPSAGEPVQITFWADELPDELIPMAPMTVETVDADDDTGETIVTAHDGMRQLEKHAVSEITLDYPTTIGRYAAALAATAGLELTAPDWIGAETILPDPPNFNGTETCRAALAALAETAFGNAYIGRDGKIVIRSVVISGEGYAIHPDSYFSCEVGSPWGPINTLGLGREPQGDNIYRADSVAVAKHGRIALQISDNPFLDSIRADVIDDMFAHINGAVIQPYELDWRGDPALDPGDVILLTDTNGVQRAAVYGAQTLEFDGGMRVAVGMNAPSNATADYTKATNVKESLRRVSLSVDKVNGRIESLAEQTYTREQTDIQLASRMEQTAERVRTEVSEKYVTQDGAEQIAASAIAQNNKEIEFRFANTEGQIQDVSDALAGNQKLLEEYIRFKGALIQLGRTDSAFTAELSNEKLAFLENGVEIAYISNNTMYITDAHISGALTIGDPDRGMYYWTVRRNGHLTLRKRRT